MDFGFEFEMDAITWAAFRLSWPEAKADAAEAPAATPKPSSKRRRLAALLVPRTIRSRLPLPGHEMQGWPVALSVPSPETARPWQPSVKLTGTPLG